MYCLNHLRDQSLLFSLWKFASSPQRSWWMNYHGNLSLSLSACVSFLLQGQMDEGLTVQFLTNSFFSKIPFSENSTF